LEESVRIDVDWRTDAAGRRVRAIFDNAGDEIEVIECESTGYKAHANGVASPTFDRLWKATDWVKRRQREVSQ
jgi:hypothetical protein